MMSLTDRMIMTIMMGLLTILRISQRREVARRERIVLRHLMMTILMIIRRRREAARRRVEWTRRLISETLSRRFVKES